MLAPVVPPSPAHTRAWRRTLRLLGPLRRRILVEQAPCRVVGAAKRRSLISSGRSDIFELRKYFRAASSRTSRAIRSVPTPHGSTPAIRHGQPEETPWRPSWRITNGAASLDGGKDGAYVLARLLLRGQNHATSYHASLSTGTNKRRRRAAATG